MKSSPLACAAIRMCCAFCLCLVWMLPVACTTSQNGSDNSADAGGASGANDNVSDDPAGVAVPLDGVADPVIASQISFEIDGDGEVIKAAVGSVVTLTAVPAEGWQFAGWEDPSWKTNPITIVASAVTDTSITVHFVEIIDDEDADGVADESDECVATPFAAAVDEAGCAVSQLDADADGVSDDIDECDSTPATEGANNAGCGPSQLDSDGDGVKNNLDACPNSVGSVDASGCSAIQLDGDLDGVLNGQDACPNSPIGAEVEPDGCTVVIVMPPDDDPDDGGDGGGGGDVGDGGGDDGGGDNGGGDNGGDVDGPTSWQSNDSYFDPLLPVVYDLDAEGELEQASLSGNVQSFPGEDFTILNTTIPLGPKTKAFEGTFDDGAGGIFEFDGYWQIFDFVVEFDGQDVTWTFDIERSITTTIQGFPISYKERFDGEQTGTRSSAGGSIIWSSVSGTATVNDGFQSETMDLEDALDDAGASLGAWTLE